jgi:hypothetical protein
MDAIRAGFTECADILHSYHQVIFINKCFDFKRLRISLFEKRAIKVIRIEILFCIVCFVCKKTRHPD